MPFCRWMMFFWIWLSLLAPDSFTTASVYAAYTPDRIWFDWIWQRLRPVKVQLPEMTSLWTKCDRLMRLVASPDQLTAMPLAAECSMRFSATLIRSIEAATEAVMLISLVPALRSSLPTTQPFSQNSLIDTPWRAALSNMQCSATQNLEIRLPAAPMKRT